MEHRIKVGPKGPLPCPIHRAHHGPTGPGEGGQIRPSVCLILMNVGLRPQSKRLRVHRARGRGGAGRRVEMQGGCSQEGTRWAECRVSDGPREMSLKRQAGRDGLWAKRMSVELLPQAAGPPGVFRLENNTIGWMPTEGFLERADGTVVAVGEERDIRKLFEADWRNPVMVRYGTEGGAGTKGHTGHCTNHRTRR